VYLFRALAALAILHLSSPAASAALFPLAGRSSNITLQKRLHINTLITQPGTLEIDWANVYSFSATNYNMPSALKYTPQGRYIVWGRTEYSLAFDSLAVDQIGGGRVAQFSQSVTLQANSVLRDGEKLDIAIAPQATLFLRDESNPAGTFDIGAGFGRQLPGAGLLAKFTPHGNVVWEKSTGAATIVSTFEGVEYQMTEHLAFDLSGQQFSVSGGVPDHQVVFGLTLNLGKLH
jgi:hypothetical protein